MRKARRSKKDTYTTAKEPLELIHTDLAGPIQENSLGGARYFIPIYDDASAISLVRFLKFKSEAPTALKEMIKELETTLQESVKRVCIFRRVRSDNGGKFLSNELQEWFKNRGIIHEVTPSYSPDSNGKAERLNRTLMDIARKIPMEISNKSYYMQLWAEAVKLLIIYVIQCTPVLPKI